MSTPDRQAAAYHTMLMGFIRTGKALHYAELARELSVTPDEALTIQRELAGSGIPIFFQADTDHIAGFTPFSSIPTHCRISVGGEQGWYGICAVEALAVSWLFPGQDVSISAACLDCRDTTDVRMRDGEILACSPETAIAHTNLPAAKWSENWAYA